MRCCESGNGHGNDRNNGPGVVKGLESRNGPGNDRNSVPGRSQKFGVKGIRFREPGIDRESRNDAETTGTGPLFGFVVLVFVIARCKSFFERLLF